MTEYFKKRKLASAKAKPNALASDLEENEQMNELDSDETLFERVSSKYKDKNLGVEPSKFKSKEPSELELKAISARQKAKMAPVKEEMPTKFGKDLDDRIIKRLQEIEDEKLRLMNERKGYNKELDSRVEKRVREYE